MSVATAAVAQHSRFKCAECNSKIEKNGGYLLMKSDASKVHVKCAGSVLDKTVTADLVKDLEHLDQADQDAIKALVAPSAKPAPAAAASLNKAGRPARGAAKKKAAEPSDDEDDDEEEEVSAAKGKRKTPAKKAKPAAAAKPKAKKSKKESESEDDEDDSVSDAKPAKKAKAAAKPSKPAFSLPPDVKAKIKAAEEALSSKSATELKDMLRKNDQAFSSLTVPELIEKVADQQVRGKIPRCPKCFGGKLRYDYRGNYKCPGYANDEGRYRACSYRATDAEVTREPWQD